MYGVRNIIVIYVSKAGADEIFNWYLSSLLGQGWQIIMCSQSEGSLTTGKGGAVLTVRVSPKERQYTEVEAACTGM